MENRTDPRSPEEKRKDTSLPGREEEVIVNTEAQQQVTNGEDEGGENGKPGDSISIQQKTSPKGERTFKEGLGNNSDTESE